MTVVATTTILGDIARNVVGDDGTVTVLIPLGADPHDYRASAAEIADLNGADLVIANGLGLEENLTDVLDAARGDGVEVLEIGPGIRPIEFGAAHHDDHEGDEEEAGDDHDHEGGLDPHFWLDHERVAEAAGLIAAELDRVAPGFDWGARADAYGELLTATGASVASTLSVIPEGRRLLVTNHESLGYFAVLYGFEVIGVVIPGGSTLADPSSRDLAELVELMEHEDVRVIFGETTRPDELAAAVAGELGEDVSVVSLFTGSLGEPGSEADTLIGMLETNARRIADALGD